MIAFPPLAIAVDVDLLSTEPYLQQDTDDGEGASVPESWGFDYGDYGIYWSTSLG